MSIDEQPVTTQANGRYSKLFPRPELDDDPPRVDDQPEPDADGGVSATLAEPEPAARQRHIVIRFAQHRHTRMTARQAVYLIAGFHRAAKNHRERHTTYHYDQMMRGAAAVGDHAMALIWEERRAKFLHDRHERRMARIHAAQRRALALGIGAGLTLGGLFAIGVALAIVNKDGHDAFGPLKGLFETIRWCVGAFDLLWLPALLTLSVGTLIRVWHLGREKAELPRWLKPAGQADRTGEPITPSIVIVALRDLGVPKLTKAIKDAADGAAAMLSAIRIAGCGVELDVTLPSGVMTADVQKNRKRLAENLHRHEHELHITIPQAARTVRLWIADSGALDEPIGPSPLVLEPDLRANYRTGRAPWGVNLRGDAVMISLFQRHMLVTGLSNQGKTASLRALVLWAILDPAVELWLADLKGVGDWACARGIASVLIEGPTDEHCIKATHMVERGVTEMERRLMAPDGTKFKPLIIVVDEAQQAFMCPIKGDDGRTYGGSKATSRYFMACRKLHNQGRAVDVLLWQGTQDPTDQNLPKLVREGAHTRVSLAVGTVEQSRMALGDRAVNGGAAPHELRAGLDKGTVVVASDGVDIPAGQASITVRTHYIDGDAAMLIGERAKTLRNPVESTATIEVEQRDVLADVAQAIGTDVRVRTEEVVHRLKKLAPSYYREWTTTELKAALVDTPAEPYKTDGGRMHVSLARVQEAIADRENKSDGAENDASDA